MTKASAPAGEMNAEPVADMDIDARIVVKAAEVTANVGVLLGDPYTRDDLERGLLFDAAWARVKLEDQQRATEESVQLNRRLMAIIEELLAILKKAEAASVADLLDWSARADAYHAAVEQTTKALVPLAERGARFTGKKRGLNRLSCAALVVLERMGANLPGKLVRRELECAGVIREQDELLHWKDREGKPKTTTVKQFENNLSRLRKQFR